MSETRYTPGPWKLGEFEDYLGYDCMTAGVRFGPGCLDGGDYGQLINREMSPASKARMLADAALISAAPELLEALQAVVAITDRKHEAWGMAHAAIARALGLEGEKT